MPIAGVGGVETRIGDPILEALLGLLDHDIHIGVLIGLPALGAIAPAEHQTALGIGRTRNGLTPLVVRIAVIIGELAETIEDHLITQLDTAQIQHGVLHGLVDVAALAGALVLQQCGQDGDQQMHAAVGIAQSRT